MMDMGKTVGVIAVMLLSEAAVAQSPSRQVPVQAAGPPSLARNPAECVQRGIA